MTTVLVISGPPCAGKSTLATQLAAALRWPLITKDGFKETLFDSLGTSDRTWSKRLSGAAYDVMFHAAEALLTAGSHCILEGNFRWRENAARFARLAHLAPMARWAQVTCDAPIEILTARLAARAARASRHPGHLDAATLDEISAGFADRDGPLPLDGPTFRYDSSLADPVNFERLIHELRQTLF